MKLIIKNNQLFLKWFEFCDRKSILECEFSKNKEALISELLGDFSSQRLLSFGEHASGSLFCLYSDKSEDLLEDAPVAWVDSGGSPCIVVAKNFTNFLAILPYGPGYIYSVAALIENNLGSNNLLDKAINKMGTDFTKDIEKTKSRFFDFDILMQWYKDQEVKISENPILDMINAHMEFSDLTDWVASNL